MNLTQLHQCLQNIRETLPDILDTEVRPVHRPADSLVDKSASIPLLGENEIGLQHTFLLGGGQVHKPARAVLMAVPYEIRRYIIALERELRRLRAVQGAVFQKERMDSRIAVVNIV